MDSSVAKSRETDRVTSSRGPTVPLELSFPWQKLRSISRRQGTRKPAIYSVHRWWARRPPELYRTILRSLVHTNGSYHDQPLRGSRVLDPFMGGGTTLVEAQRLGAEVIGFDTQELACRITALELSSPPSTHVWDEIDNALRPIERRLRQFYVRRHDWEVLHYFWVDSVTCRSCRHSFHAHPQALLARDPQRNLRAAFCLYCSRLHLLPARRTIIDCRCGRVSNDTGSNARDGKYICPWCGYEEVIRQYISRSGGAPPERKLLAKEEVNGRTSERRFRAVTEVDRAAFGEAESRFRRYGKRLPIPSSPVVTIPHDSRPRSYGYRKYRDMFNARQLLHHGTVLQALLRLREPARSIALLAFSEALETNCMFCPYSTDWRRLAGVLSIHGYMYVTRPVELNPWLRGVGRGTLFNCIRRIRRALESKRSDATAVGAPRIRVGSLDSDEGGPRVDFVVTDPPYFDNLDYAYLARFHSVWLKGAPMPAGVIERIGGEPLAAGRSGVKSAGGGEFERRLVAIFGRCRRLLKRDGLLVFTFAHRREEAWRSLSAAIRSAGFRVTAVYGVECEGRNGFHAGEGNLRWNALFVCRCRRRGKGNQGMRSVELRRAIELRTVSAADRESLMFALKAAKRSR